ncbi:unnamed protein product, partial [Symbiodinium sp. CCMP2456]
TNPSTMVVSFGLVCSSFVSVSRGSTGRSFWLPTGNEKASASVRDGNLLAARTLMAMLLIEALGGVWVLEQPVYKQSFWMSAWGATTPKRTTLWSNSRAIRKFATAARFGRVKNAPKLTHRYYRNGVCKFQGNEKLK